ncbi:tetratricopeptide repeat protein [Desulfobacula sp.]|uniref:tetratricopeptide repeat protein n=1 Tax=Desulfobacula sp. TaxID=2593537 RepID=UPI0026275D95|nr:tetratricopeptide repeat protein [Desulfobacula sp.]
MRKQCFGVIFFLILVLVLTSNGVAGESDTTTDKVKLPLAAGICINKAQVLFQNGQMHQAIDLLEAFISKGKKGSDHYYLHFLLGNYYLTLAGREDQLKNSRQLCRRATVCYQASVKQTPLFAQGWLNLAKAQYESESFAQAATAFVQGYNTSQAPKPEYLYSAAVCYFQATDSKKALEVFHRLIRAHPEAISLSYKETLVHILFSLESHQQALPYIKDLAKESRGPKKKQWQEILLHQYLSLNMDQRALAYADFLTQTDPLDPKWWKALCHIHLNNQRVHQGLSALIIYGYLAPMTREEQMLAADLYLFLNVPAKAARFYANAITAAPTPDSILRISQAFAMAHDQENALAWIEKGLAQYQDPRLLKLKAHVLYTRGDLQKIADIHDQLKFYFKSETK